MNNYIFPERIQERDMSRADFQRKTGVVVTRELADAYYPDSVPEMSRDDIEWIEGNSRAFNQFDGKIQLWYRAYSVSKWLMRSAILDVRLADESSFPEDIREDFTNNTHYGYLGSVMHEGRETQVHFPISLARAIDKQAERNGVAGLAPERLSDIGATLRRPDFHDMVDQAAFTNNGFWQTFSTDRNVMTVTHGTVEFVDMFDLSEAPDAVRFTDEFQGRLLDSLRTVNRLGKSRLVSGFTGDRPSSGCPARRTRPQFTDSPADQARLQMLSDHFEKPAEILTAEHDQSVVTKYLDLTADALDAADAAYETHRVYLGTRAAKVYV